MNSTEKKLPVSQGIYEETFVLGDGTPLRYTLSIPSDFSPEEQYSLIVALHYGGPVTPWYSKDFLTMLVEPAFKELNAIIIAPDCPGKEWNNFFSESAVLALVNFIKENYSIDDKRVLITGFSLGGIGTWYIAARHSDIFSAAIPVSGITDQETLEKIGSLPLYVIHSNSDEIIPFEPVVGIVNELKNRGASIEFVVLDGISHYHTGRFVEPMRKAIPWIKAIWEKK